VIGKLFEKLLKSRLNNVLMAPGALSERQFGWKVDGERGRGDAKDNRCLQRGYVIALLFDISGTFDVWWPLVLESLKERECLKNVFEIMKNYFDNRKVEIRYGNSVSSRRRTQGVALKAQFWSRYAGISCLMAC
jgi:hypothetical protein